MLLWWVWDFKKRTNLYIDPVHLNGNVMLILYVLHISLPRNKLKYKKRLHFTILLFLLYFYQTNAALVSMCFSIKPPMTPNIWILYCIFFFCCWMVKKQRQLSSIRVKWPTLSFQKSIYLLSWTKKLLDTGSKLLIVVFAIYRKPESSM